MYTLSPEKVYKTSPMRQMVKQMVKDVWKFTRDAQFPYAMCQ